MSILVRARFLLFGGLIIGVVALLLFHFAFIGALSAWALIALQWTLFLAYGFFVRCPGCKSRLIDAFKGSKHCFFLSSHCPRCDRDLMTLRA